MSEMQSGGKPEKPLGHKAYGSIPHLPGSRRGPGDYGLSFDQANILTKKTRDDNDLVIVQEKLDGSCVSVAKINGEIVPLIRAGYRATDSKYEQHHYFHKYVMKNERRFKELLIEGERCVGEWLMQAHGTIYRAVRDPFVIFDLMERHHRHIVDSVVDRCGRLDFFTPITLHRGGPISITNILMKLTSAYDPMGGPEGAVWRVERFGRFDFIGKFVRQDKFDGRFLPEKSNEQNAKPIWNYSPEQMRKETYEY